MATNIIKQSTGKELLYPRTRLTASDDMNSVDYGTYYQASGSSSMPANAPSGAYNAFIMVVSARYNDRIQFWYSINTGSIYTRYTTDWVNGASSNWTAWKEIVPA